MPRVLAMRPNDECVNERLRQAEMLVQQCQCQAHFRVEVGGSDIGTLNLPRRGDHAFVAGRRLDRGRADRRCAAAAVAV